MTANIQKECFSRFAALCGSRRIWTLGLVLLVGPLACGEENRSTPTTLQAAPTDADHPFPRRIDVPEFPADLAWINTKGPVRLADLRGKFVLLDFWTYCCINCMHVLPELKKLEQAYPQELVVVGVHSAKFEAEAQSPNIVDAVRRYEIEHPVVNDHHHTIWQTFGVRSWPTLLLIDPEGKAVYGRAGEITFETFDEVLKQALPYYRDRGLLNTQPLDLLSPPPPHTSPLLYPGKVLADETGNRLFIADSNHNRIVVTDLSGKLLFIAGTGEMGRHDGPAAVASFHHPQGMALADEMLYIADTENHLLRKLDLTTRQVTTLAGTGEQAREGWLDDPQFDLLPAHAATPWLTPPLQTALNSPWDVWVAQGYVWIAMAGPHQIWRIDVAATHMGPYAGNGREDIVDGPRLPTEPYGLGACSLAQPSGLSADADWLYVADSEGSSIRAVPFDPQAEVRTLVGTADRPAGERLFTFGDQDGPPAQAKLQHALGVTHHAGILYVADTYNNKIKQIELRDGSVTTLSLQGPAGPNELFDEPAGISYAGGKLYVADTNHHRIQVIDVAQKTVSTLVLSGLPTETGLAP